MKKYQTIDQFFLECPAEKYGKGHTICRPDDAPGSIFYLESGYVKSYSVTLCGDEKIYLIYKPTEIFPILYTLDKQPLTKFYQSLSPIVIRRAPTDVFIRLISDNSKILLQVTKRIANFLDIYRNRIDNLEFTNARSRLISRLLFLEQRLGVIQNGTKRFAVKVTHYDIAGSIALARETVSRELEKLEKNGLIKIDEGYISIPDRSKLEELLDKDKLQ